VNIILFSEDERSFPKGDERSEHIRKVLRLSVGDSFLGGIYNGMSGMCEITSMDDGVAFSFTPSMDSSSLERISVILSMVRPICMRRILRELVSLGVGRIILACTELGEKSYMGSSLYTTDEYLGIMKSGAMQAGRTGVSEALFSSSVPDAIRKAGNGNLILFDNVIGATSLSKLTLDNERETVIAIGPERGFTDNERMAFLGSGYTPVLMGERILRTETAAVGSVVLTLSALGRI